jgi:hypothetical protein
VAESASLGASYAGFGLSFGSGATTAEQFIDKACEFVNTSERAGRINVTKLNQLAAEAGESYRACLGLYAKGLQSNVRLSDASAQQVLLGLVYNGGPQTVVAGIPTRNYECSIEPRAGLRTRTKVSDISFPLAISGGADGSLNIVCVRQGRVTTPQGQETWPEASIGLSISGDPVVFSYSAVTNLPARDAATIASRVDGLEKLMVPIGSIIDWFRPDKSTLVPDGYQLCDGAKIVDPFSPLTGQATPNLVDRFTMGVTAARIGETAGRANIPKAGTHSHGGRTSGFAGYMPGEVNYDVRRGHPSEYHIESVIGPDGEHDHGGENRPPYVGVLKIMRIR